MPWVLRSKLSLIGLSFGQPEKSAAVKHIMDIGHDIKFNNTYRLDKATGYTDHLVKEAREIWLHHNQFNREGGFIFSSP
jgi:hypothetical protein